MEKFINFLNKNVALFIAILVVLMLMQTCNGCRNNSANQEIKKIIDEVSQKAITENEIDIIIDILRNRTAYRVVYDNNTIVRTKERPDDVMNKYNEEYENLIKKLDKIRESKRDVDKKRTKRAPEDTTK